MLDWLATRDRALLANLDEEAGFSVGKSLLRVPGAEGEVSDCTSGG